MNAWYLATTKLKTELRVKQALLSRHGIASFFPVFPARKARSPIGLPLFPRYIFVNFEMATQLDQVRFTPGVLRLVAFGEQICPVPEEVITCLRARCDGGDVVREDEIATGRRVEVTQGVFEGFRGIIAEKRGAHRVQLLIQLAFGAPLKIEVERHCVALTP